MQTTAFQYEFDTTVPMEEVESSLLLAVLAVESLHGETQVQLHASHSIDLAKRSCVINVVNEVGRDLNHLFAGFLRREFDRRKFSVRRRAVAITVPARSDNSHEDLLPALNTPIRNTDQSVSR